ncbi:hypothetical protein [Streptomyces fungicidicus]|uniref:hypothetical protein n=1 Tax=Streptomyces fungicidicus TaxID=68203 RepID=UPI003D70EED2
MAEIRPPLVKYVEHFQLVLSIKYDKYMIENFIRYFNPVNKNIHLKKNKSEGVCYKLHMSVQSFDEERICLKKIDSLHNHCNSYPFLGHRKNEYKE